MISPDAARPRANAARIRYRGKVKPGPLEGVGHFLRENEWFWSFLFLGVVGWLFVQQFRVQPPPSMPLDSVAPRDIPAPFNLEIQDQVATSQKRREAVERVPPVYDWDSSKAAAVSASIASFFAEARGRMGEFDQFQKAPNLNPAQRKEAEETFLLRLSESVGGGMSRFGLRQFVSDGFSPQLEQTVDGILGEVMSRKIVPAEDRFQGRDVIQIRDIRKIAVEWEQKDPTAGDILAITEARSLLGPLIESRMGLSSALKGAIEEYARILVVPTLTFNSQETARRQEVASGQVAPLVITVKKGQPLVKMGERVTDEVLQKIAAFQQESRSLVNLPLIGALLLCLLLLLAFTWIYLKSYRKEHFPGFDLFVVFLQIASGSVLLAYVVQWIAATLAAGAKSPLWGQENYTFFLIPVAAGAVLVTLLVDKHVGAIFAIFYAVLFGILQDMSILALLFALLSSFAAIYGASKLAQRATQWKTGFLLGAVNIVLAVGILAAWSTPKEIPLGEVYVPISMAFLGGLTVTPLVVLAFLPLFESAYGVLTEIRLLQLSNMNHPLLKKLALEAPGTYNHSIMMASLSETAASAIGANSLFCRVACYFHDAGKLFNPILFVENQAPGHNPHDRLVPVASARIVAAHVKEGLAMGREHRLPDGILAIIPQHHGTRRISYFYDKALTMVDPEKEAIKEEYFRYPGPKPQSREAAIIMLADGVEAGSRLLKNPSDAQLHRLIQEITDRAIREEQFTECGLTFEDVALIQQAFFKILQGVFSRRISYPNYTFDKEGENGQPEGSGASDPPS